MLYDNDRLGVTMTIPTGGKHDPVITFPRVHVSGVNKTFTNYPPQDEDNMYRVYQPFAALVYGRYSVEHGYFSYPKPVYTVIPSGVPVEEVDSERGLFRYHVWAVEALLRGNFDQVRPNLVGLDEQTAIEKVREAHARRQAIREAFYEKFGNVMAGIRG